LERAVILGGGSGVLVPRAVFTELGGFDPRLSTSADWEFFYRLAGKYEIGFIAEPLVLYRMHDSNMHGNIGAMEHDVLIGFEKAFADDTAGIREMRQECYGNFHLMLAGSYFRANNYPAFLKHAAKSLWYRPGHIGNYLAFPFRKLKNS
jgi:glycosyl transferase family 2